MRKSSRIALAYLRAKQCRNQLWTTVLGLNLKDLALDCVAELFRRDEEGCFYLIRNYLKTVDLDAVGEDRLATLWRRLVLSKVNDALFRRYREVDPSLARIIRNVKGAVQDVDTLTTRRYNGRLWLVLADSSPEDWNLPLVPTEFLEAYLIAGLKDGMEHTRATLETFSNFISAHPEYRPGFPLTLYTQTLRAAFVNGCQERDEYAGISSSSSSKLFSNAQVEKTIAQATRAVAERVKSTYVPKKMTEEAFTAYMHAARDVLRSDFVDNHEEVDSYYDALIKYRSDVTKEAYRASHRNRMEYLVKLVRADLIERLQVFVEV